MQTLLNPPEVDHRPAPDHNTHFRPDIAAAVKVLDEEAELAQVAPLW